MGNLFIDPSPRRNNQALERLTPFRREIEHCVRCGLCQSVCPLYKETGLEGSVARGKMSLLLGLLDGQLSPTANLQGKLDSCLMCKACAAICPAGVKVDELVVLGRQAVAGERGLPLLKRVALQLLTGRGWWHGTLFSLGRLWQSLWLKRSENHRGGRPRFSLIGLPDRLYPLIGGTQASSGSFQLLEERRAGVSSEPPRAASKTDEPGLIGSQADPRPIGIAPGAAFNRGRSSRLGRTADDEGAQIFPHHPRVAFFPGCAIESFYPEIGTAVQKALERREREVIIPQGLVCCGAPAHFAGDRAKAVTLARKNLAVLIQSGAEAIVTACASGGLMLKKEYADLLEGEEAEAARALGQRVFDISEYLVQVDAAISAGGTKPAPTGGTVASSVDSSLGSSGFRRGGKTAIEENGLAASVGAASKQQQFGDMTVYRADSARALSEYQQPGGGSGHWADPAPRSLSQRRGGFRGPVQDKLDLNRTARHLKVTYHDPCHLNRGQGIGQEPRQVIASLPGVELVEGKEAARCCGGAGTFAFFHQPISEAILKRKVDDILATGADVVATGCPSCLMQLESGLSQAQSRVRVLHTVELLAMAEERVFPSFPSKGD